MPYTLAQAVHSELVIKKSRFIGCVQPVQDRAQALVIVQGLREQHPGANHVCWALMAGGQSAAVDDGEPSGTAGRPMLDVLRHQQIEGALATVVRYFGASPGPVCNADCPMRLKAVCGARSAAPMHSCST